MSRSVREELSSLWLGPALVLLVAAIIILAIFRPSAIDWCEGEDVPS